MRASCACWAAASSCWCCSWASSTSSWLCHLMLSCWSEWAFLAAALIFAISIQFAYSQAEISVIESAIDLCLVPQVAEPNIDKTAEGPADVFAGVFSMGPLSLSLLSSTSPSSPNALPLLPSRLGKPWCESHGKSDDPCESSSWPSSASQWVGDCGGSLQTYCNINKVYSISETTGTCPLSWSSKLWSIRLLLWVSAALLTTRLVPMRACMHIYQGNAFLTLPNERYWISGLYTLSKQTCPRYLLLGFLR